MNKIFKKQLTNIKDIFTLPLNIYKSKYYNKNKSINNSTNNIINIPFSDCKLKLLNTKIQEQLTFKYLERVLREIIKNETHVNQIIEQLKLKRSNKIIQEIKRFSNN